MGTRRVRVRVRWNLYLYRTRTRFLKIRPMPIYNPFSSPIWVLNGADFSSFKRGFIAIPTNRSNEQTLSCRQRSF